MCKTDREGGSGGMQRKALHSVPETYCACNIFLLMPKAMVWSNRYAYSKICLSVYVVKYDLKVYQ